MVDKIRKKLTQKNSKFIKLFVGEPEPIGCSSDFECATNQACRDRSCINICSVDKPCSQSAICSSRNHKASCSCPPGFEGDPYRQCNKSKKLALLFTSEKRLGFYFRTPQ